MTALLVPHGVRTDAARVWIAFAEEGAIPGDLSLDVGGAARPIHGGWRSFDVSPGSPMVQYRWVDIDGLAPDTTYALALSAGGRTLATASTRTLPERLPLQGEEPFTVLSGSCYCHLNPSASLLERALARMPVAHRPNVKLLSGDQVYLDAPAERFMRVVPMSEVEMRARFCESYLRTWTSPGFSALLRAGASYFTADDHELWNNAPNAAAYATDTWTAHGRERWMRVAQELYDAFQGAPPLQTFDVGQLSFAVLDTRMHRARDRSAFVDPAVMVEVRAWVGRLRGPGVLVVGQPLLDERAGMIGHVADWHLADYEQMQDLVRILSTSRHAIVILTGDVHFGRVASVTLPSGQEMVEVISSPMALVVRGKRPHARPPPGRFAGVGTRFDQPFEPAGDHFVTLDFTAAGDAVDMTVRHWPISDASGAPRSLPPRRLR